MDKTPPSIKDVRQYMRKAACSDEHEMLYVVARAMAATRILEIGTEYGLGTTVLGEAARQNAGRLHTVDLVDCAQAKANIKTLKLENHVTFYQQDGKHFLEGNQNRDVTFDLVFEDSAHTHPYTREVLELVHPLLRTGGVIAVHDTTIDEVMWSLKEFLDKHDYERMGIKAPTGMAFLIKV